MSERIAVERGNPGGVISVSVIGGVVWALQAIVYVAYMVTIVPKHEEIFKDFGVALPGISVAAIRLSRDFCGTNPGQVFSVQWALIPLWMACLAAITFVCARRPTMRTGTVFLILGVLWALLSTGALVLAMKLPLQGMTNALEGAP